jgi:hypothetical protein
MPSVRLCYDLTLFVSFWRYGPCLHVDLDFSRSIASSHVHCSLTVGHGHDHDYMRFSGWVVDSVNGVCLCVLTSILFVIHVFCKDDFLR